MRRRTILSSRLGSLTSSDVGTRSRSYYSDTSNGRSDTRKRKNITMGEKAALRTWKVRDGSETAGIIAEFVPRPSRMPPIVPRTRWERSEGRVPCGHGHRATARRAAVHRRASTCGRISKPQSSSRARGRRCDRGLRRPVSDVRPSVSKLSAWARRACGKGSASRDPSLARSASAGLSSGSSSCLRHSECEPWTEPDQQMPPASRIRAG